MKESARMHACLVSRSGVAPLRRLLFSICRDKLVG